jgi:hypothetical protein
LVLIALLIGVVVLTDSSYRRKTIMRKVAERVEGFDRYVDIGVVLRVVRLDPAGDVELDSGRRARVIREHRWGGVVDTNSAPPRLVGPSRDPKEWMCSEQQERIILHSDADPLGLLVVAGEGAGKTTALAMWHHKRWVECLGEYREGGQTAPVLKRLGLVKDEFLKLWRPSWGRYCQRDDFEGFELCDGSRIRFTHTHRQSAAAGSPIQGYNWSWAGRDETQDQVDVHLDIESRGRAAKGGRYKQLGTATAKDDPQWRTLRDALVAGGQWAVVPLSVVESPFVAANFLEIKRASGVTDREFRRRWLAEDLPPESRLYSTWDRNENLRPIPLGAKKITSVVLSRKTGDRSDAMLVGHDPGAAKSGTVWLDAYEIPQRRGEVLWWVRGELFTLHSTHEQHAVAALKIARERFGTNIRADGEQAHVRCQPLGQSEDKPDLEVFAIWKRIGFRIRAAQYSKTGQGIGQIKKESRIGVLNTLFCDAMNRRRLFVECDDMRKPVAPLLVEALETMERDYLGRAERDEKNVKHDKSDLPAALGYALWPFERETASNLRADIRRSL